MVSAHQLTKNKKSTLFPTQGPCANLNSTSIFIFLFFSDTATLTVRHKNAPLDTRADPSSGEETCASSAPSAGMPDDRTGIHGAALADQRRAAAGRRGGGGKLVESAMRETWAWMAAAVPIGHPAVWGFGDDM